MLTVIDSAIALLIKHFLTQSGSMFEAMSASKKWMRISMIPCLPKWQFR